MTHFRSAASSNVVDRSRVADQIFRDLKSQIVSGALPRGAKLPAEKDLAERYGVSGPTVREAIRGLTATGLVDVRHGSGAYVTADGEALVAMSLGAIIQLESIGAADALSVLGILNEHAVALAVEHATPEDLARLRLAMEAFKTIDATDIGASAAAVRRFHRCLSAASHNALLAALCGFLSDLQAELATELAGGSAEVWRHVFEGLTEPRAKVVEAIEARDRDGAVSCMRAFQAAAFRLITNLPKAQEVRLTDPKFGTFLGLMMNRLTTAG